MNTGKVGIGALAGLALGAIAGILLAPEKGSETRKQIANKGNEFMDKINSKLDEFSNLLSDKFKRTNQDAEQLVDKGRENYNEVKRNVKNAAANLQNDVSADANNIII